MKKLSKKIEADIQDRATAITRHIFFPEDKRTDEEVANELRNAIIQFRKDKKAGKIKPVSDDFRL